MGGAYPSMHLGTWVCIPACTWAGSMDRSRAVAKVGVMKGCGKEGLW